MPHGGLVAPTLAWIRAGFGVPRRLPSPGMRVPTYVYWPPCVFRPFRWRSNCATSSPDYLRAVRVGVGASSAHHISIHALPSSFAISTCAHLGSGQVFKPVCPRRPPPFLSDEETKKNDKEGLVQKLPSREPREERSLDPLLPGRR